MKAKIFVDGQEGTTGLRLLDYLNARDDLELLRIDETRRKDPAERKQLLNAADIAFLCLPDGAAREAVELLENPSTCLIDASTAHRIQPDWVYGLPELAAGQREALRQTSRIAVPGCHASAFILLTRPLVDAGLIAADHLLSAFSLTGYSGGGKKMIAQYEGADGLPVSAKLNSPRPYALEMNHKHLPEMRYHGGLTLAPIFNPVVGRFAQGLAVTIPLSPQAHGTEVAAIRAAWQQRYQGERFVRVLAADEALDEGSFDVQACNGSNRVELAVFGSSERAALIARLDNLGKGAAGAAVQCMNLRLGVDEGCGLLA